MPPRLLLSQSQVSAVVSSAVVFIFTALLFLSGYVLQQQTVQSLKVAIQPRIPQAPLSHGYGSDQQPLEGELLPSSRFFGRDGGRVAYADLNRDVHSPGTSIDWRRLAHVQLVSDHHHVCNAIMLLAELHMMKSPARRLLLFPRDWAEQKKEETEADPYMASTRRLLKLAAKRYHVELHPVEPVNDRSEGLYSLASAYALEKDFDRLLVLETPGLLLDSEPLDAILGFTEAAPFVMLHDTTENDGVHSQDMYLLQPSKKTYAHLKEQLASPGMAGFNDTQLGSIFDDPVLLASSDESSALIRSVGVLHDVGENFNQTAYLADVAYIRYSDPKLPGPEYEVPWPDKVAARPKNRDADWVWTDLYGRFAQKRMDICGLDLEAWRP